MPNIPPAIASDELAIIETRYTFEPDLLIIDYALALSASTLQEVLE